MKIKKILIIGLSILALAGCKRPSTSSNNPSTSSSEIISSSQTSTNSSNSSIQQNSSQTSQSSSINQGVGEQEKEFDFVRTVTFNSNGGSSVIAQEVEEGKKATKPADPTKGEETFLGWYLDGQLYNFDSPVYFDITLEARWELPQ